MIVVTQIPFLFTLPLVVEPGLVPGHASRGAEQLHRGRHDSQFWTVALNTVVLIVVVVGIGVPRPVARCCWIALSCRGVVRTLLITPS
jgi:sorbitol/mannitol transport system permease protein